MMGQLMKPKKTEITGKSQCSVILEPAAGSGPWVLGSGSVCSSKQSVCGTGVLLL